MAVRQGPGRAQAAEMRDGADRLVVGRSGRPPCVGMPWVTRADISYR
jgi:hypothetical protein